MRESRVVPLRPMPPEGTERIALENVHLSVGGKPLLRGADLTLGHMGITVLVGPNGAGKSLILRLLARLFSPDRGQIHLDPALQPVALVFQRPVLLRRTVRANLAHALKIAGVARKQRPGRIAELLVQASLTQRSETPARRLSGGEQQRLQMVRALAASPGLLLLDEPTASLDPASTAAIEVLIRRIADEGVKIVMVTHNRAQAERLAHDVAFLDKGRVLEHGPARSFFSNPKTPEAQAYLNGDLHV